MFFHVLLLSQLLSLQFFLPTYHAEQEMVVCVACRVRLSRSSKSYSCVIHNINIDLEGEFSGQMLFLTPTCSGTLTQPCDTEFSISIVERFTIDPLWILLQQD